MPTKFNITKALATLAILLTIIWTCIGYELTLYSLGVYLTPIIWFISAAIAGLMWLVFKRYRQHCIRVFWIVNIILFAALIISELVNNYKPTITVYIPQNYEGVVHIFFGEGDNKEAHVDENGIGYFAWQGEADWCVMHGEVDITDALNESGSGQLTFWSADSLSYQSITTSCFEAEHGRVYPTTPWNQRHSTCMDEQEYLELVGSGVIDETKVKMETWQVD